MAGRSWRPRRGQGLSLRARLAWTLVLPLAGLLALVGVVSIVTLQHQLIAQIDIRLGAALSRSFHAAGSDPGPPPNGAPSDADGDLGPAFLGARGQSAGMLGARVVDGRTVQAGVITERGPDQYLDAQQEQVIAHVPAGDRPRTLHLGGGFGDYRVVAARAPDGNVIVTGLPLTGTETAVAKLILAEGVAGLAGLLVTALAGSLVVRRTLAPLSRVAATASRVTELPLASGEVVLAQRVPEPDCDPRTEVGRVGSALNQLLDHVEQSLAVRQASEMRVRQFVADASHELRTPLASIRGYAEFFRRHQGAGSTATSDEVAHTLRRVESEAVRMSRLVDELLLLARLDAGRDLEIGEADLTMIAIDAAGDAHVAAPHHHWQLDLPSGAVLVQGDAARLHQVVANLLSNVRTHTPEGTIATVQLRVEDTTAILSVIDDGPGIPVPLQTHVFERFARGEASRSRAAGSTGLGLAVVAALVAAHGGAALLTSQPGRTEFTVRLPGATLAEADVDSGGDVAVDPRPPA